MRRMKTLGDAASPRGPSANCDGECDLTVEPAPDRGDATSAPRLESPPVSGKGGQTEQRPVRIGVIIRKLESPSTENALQYLALHMNRLQRFFEYEFLPLPECRFVQLFEVLSEASPIRRVEKVKPAYPSFVREYALWLEAFTAGFQIKEPPPKKFVILSDVTFDDSFYVTGNGDVQVVALGEWRDSMSPPSIVEFFLTLLLRASLALVCPDTNEAVHFGTKGCLCDFTADLTDVRFKVLHAFICRFCRESIEKDAAMKGLPDALLAVLDGSWLGTSADPSSPASISAKLGYDLFRVKGLKPTYLNKTLTMLEEDGTKELIKLVTTVFAVLIGAALLAYCKLSKS
jgi:hypothetical protein